MSIKAPRTPFSTHLSGSAKETELRLRSIFQWEKKRPPVWAMTVMLLLAVSCGGLVGCQVQESQTASVALRTSFDNILGLPWIKAFDADELSMLFHIGTWEERKTAQVVLTQADQAFSVLGLTEAQANEEYGLLSRYAAPFGCGVVTESHSLRLLSAQFTQDEGRMWVLYTQEFRDADGGLVSGAWNIPGLWSLEPNENEEWIVCDIKDAP